MKKRIVREYIKAINEADVNKLYSLMAVDHIFIDAHGSTVSGKDANKESWRGYFKMFPDYTIEVTDILERDSLFAVFGYASGTYKNVKDKSNSNYYRVPAAWKVVVENNLIKHWQVYTDSGRAIEIYKINEPTTSEQIL